MKALVAAILCFAITLVSAAPCLAEDIRYISVGQKYYWTGITYDELVIVTAVDRDRNRVQVTRQDGEVVWLAPSSLITSEQATQNSIARGIVVAGGLMALMDGGKSSSAAPPPRPSTASSNRSFTLCNKTTKGTLSSAVAYETASGWQAFGWYRLQQGACQTFTQMAGDRVLYFATDDTTLHWSGTTLTCVHPRDRFTLAYSATCTAPYEARGFVSKSLTAGNNSFNFID